MADSKTLLALNLGSQRVGGALFGRTPGGELVLKKYQVADMAGDPSVDATRIPQLRVAMAELASSMRLKGSSAWLTVPGHSVFTRFVKLPPVRADKVGQIVEFEARQNVPFPINEVSWDYEFVSPDDFGEREVVLAAMKRDALNEFNDQVASAGVATSGVDIAPLATYNAFRYSYPEVDETCVIIDLGARSTNLIFVEAGRMFTRNLLVGGASVTNAISKEFGIGFGDAEAQKVSQGFIALGGTVSDHDDPNIAALSKVIRNAMTRLHGEVLRTVNYYRAQQGGGAIQRIFLAGGGAQMGFVSEFFQEKFKVPVEIFNALRGVQIANGVNQEAIMGDAHTMGEVVGLALRSLGATPSEVELVPDSVAAARDAKKRAPALVMAGLCVWGALGAGITYVKQATATVQDKMAELTGKSETLQEFANGITEATQRLESAKEQSAQIEEAVNDRSYWVRMLQELNNKFTNDFIWLTVVEPAINDSSLSPTLTEAGAQQANVVAGVIGASSSLFSPLNSFTPPVARPGGDSTPPPAVNADQGAQGGKTIVRLLGLYRKNDQGQEVVYSFAKSLAKSEFFDAPNINEALNDYCKAEAGVSGDRYAYTFEIRLPLKSPMKFKK
jgi:type IV pilus assembly protein PilM